MSFCFIRHSSTLKKVWLIVFWLSLPSSFIIIDFLPVALALDYHFVIDWTGRRCTCRKYLYLIASGWIVEINPPLDWLIFSFPSSIKDVTLLSKQSNDPCREAPACPPGKWKCAAFFFNTFLSPCLFTCVLFGAEGGGVAKKKLFGVFVLKWCWKPVVTEKM